MRTRAAARVAWSSCALTGACWGLALSLRILGGAPLGPTRESSGAAGDALFAGLVVTTFVSVAILGALIAARTPQNVVGWLICGASVIIGYVVFAGGYAGYALHVAPGSPPGAATAVVAWLGACLGIANPGFIAPILLTFPDGRLPSHRWRPLLWLAGVGAAVGAASVALAPGPLPNVPAIANPFGLPGAEQITGRLRAAGQVGVQASALIAAGALVLRLRRARGDERQQLKWVAYGAVIWTLTFLVTFLATFLASPASQAAAAVGYHLALDLFLVALGVAIFKYRLYEIDLVINKTLVYAGLALFITGVYALLVVGIGAAVGTWGESNLGLSLLATALVAVLFQPLRERLQRLANRLVYGQRASPYEVLAGFSRRLSGALSVDEVLPRLAEAAARGVGATRARARVAVPGGPDQAACWPATWPLAGAGEPRDGVAASFERVVPVQNQGEPVGEIAVATRQGQRLTGAEETLLRDLAAQAGPALSNVRLALELRTQADELRASRQRLVAAQDAERRRLERDLHDGAQQDLVAVAVNARLAREVLRSEPAEAEGLLDELVAQAGAALATLRDVAHGIFPPALADQGLAAAVEAHLAKARWPAALETEGAVASARYAPAIEAAVYFCVLEAVQNATKHAPGAPATVRLAAAGDGLRFTVSDRGPGFDPARAHGGTGLQGMADRLAAVGGMLEMRSQPGQGTIVSGRVPVHVAQLSTGTR